MKFLTKVFNLNAICLIIIILILIVQACQIKTMKGQLKKSAQTVGKMDIYLEWASKHIQELAEGEEEQVDYVGLSNSVEDSCKSGLLGRANKL